MVKVDYQTAILELAQLFMSYPCVFFTTFLDPFPVFWSVQCL